MPTRYGLSSKQLLVGARDPAVRNDEKREGCMQGLLFALRRLGLYRGGTRVQYRL
jgi:hypothetical protein